MISASMLGLSSVISFLSGRGEECRRRSKCPATRKPSRFPRPRRPGLRRTVDDIAAIVITRAMPGLCRAAADALTLALQDGSAPGKSPAFSCHCPLMERQVTFAWEPLSRVALAT